MPKSVRTPFFRWPFGQHLENVRVRNILRLTAQQPQAKITKLSLEHYFLVQESSIDQLEIPILNDNVFEGNETFSIAIGNEQGDIDLGVTRTAIVTIEDEDVADSNALVFEQDSYSILENQSDANIRIRSFGQYQYPTATVDFSTSEDSAGTEDYTNISLTVEFLPGETYKDVKYSYR